MSQEVKVLYHSDGDYVPKASYDYLKEENARLMEAAARWEALMSSQRIRVLGSARLGKEHQHLGLELWETFPEGHGSTGHNTLTVYVDGIRERQKKLEGGPRE